MEYNQFFAKVSEIAREASVPPAYILEGFLTAYENEKMSFFNTVRTLTCTLERHITPLNSKSVKLETNDIQIIISKSPYSEDLLILTETQQTSLWMKKPAVSKINCHVSELVETITELEEFIRHFKKMEIFVGDESSTGE